MDTSDIVLAINSGSSSLKFALYRFTQETETLLVRGQVNDIAHAESHLHMFDAATHQTFDSQDALADHAAAAVAILDQLAERGYPAPTAVGHRLVNGGPNHS